MATAETMGVYCLSCKEMKTVEVASVEFAKAKNGRGMARAVCPKDDCGRKLSKFLSASETASFAV